MGTEREEKVKYCLSRYGNSQLLGEGVDVMEQREKALKQSSYIVQRLYKARGR